MRMLWLILFYTVNCEWVEITPIVNRKPSLEVKQVIQTTTPASYEAFMKTPIFKNEYSFTTPLSNNIKSNENESTTVKTYRSGTDISSGSTIDISEPISRTESFSNMPILQQEDEDVVEPSHLSYEGFLPFLKMIQDNLFKYKNKSRRSKMSLLKHLRDHLLMNIKERITNLWKPFETPSEARGYKDDDSHMDFPSNEGALMTIGFLTFAVFLIKLVIKLVHALKYKQQYYSMTTTTTAASVVFLKRKKREEVNEEASKVLQYIDEF